MSGDVKRPRLSSPPQPHQPPLPSSSHSQRLPPLSSHHLPVSHPPPPPHSAHQPHHHPHLPPSHDYRQPSAPHMDERHPPSHHPQYHQHPASDARPPPPQYGPPSAGPQSAHPPPPPHPYAHHRHYSNEPMSARTPTTPSHPGPPIENSYRPPPPPGHYPEHYPPPPPPPPVHPESHSHYPNHDYRGEGPSPHSAQYHEPSHGPPQSPYDQGGYYQGYSSAAPVQANGNPKRKAVRASQACESCRQKKCKCDEEKPVCGTCQANNTECHYRDIPPPKQERSMNQLIETLESLHKSVMEEAEYNRSQFKQLHSRMDVLAHQSASSSTPAIPHSAQLGSHAVSSPMNGPIDGRYRNHDTKYEASSMASPAESPRPTLGRPDKKHPNRSSTARERIDKEIAERDMLDGQLSIPMEHHTAAHKLLQYWKAIEKFYQDITDNDYVMREEMRRGVLKIFSRGEARGQKTRFSKIQVAPSPAQSDHGSAVSNVSDGSWGRGFDSSPTRTPAVSKPTEGNPGGMNADNDALALDPETIRDLRQSYLENIHVLHPFVSKQDLILSSERLISQWNPATRPSHKRKRSASGTEGAKAQVPHGETAVERSISNAVVLLVLALGKVCKSKDWESLHPVDDSSPTGPADTMTPPSNYSTPQPHHSPHGMPNSGFGYGSHHTPTNMPSPGIYAENRPRNVDRMPGMAYYAYAVDILGETLGSAELNFVQACLLAGLYMGQFLRVIDSWKWIHQAGTTCQLLFKEKGDLDHYTPQYAELIRVAFWSCHQLESDIVAELDQLPHSGISRFEDLIEHPKPSTYTSGNDKDEEMIYLYYSAQIEIRKLLNRAHTALYTSGRERIRNAGWSTSNADILADSLTNWRQFLPGIISFADRETPATHINDARLRGKYYGAQYVIHRPFLHHLMQKEAGQTDSNDEWTIKTSKDKMEMGKKCVEAAIESTIAFDGLPGRIISTNVFGTAHAQFGNCLVLSAVYMSRLYNWMVSEETITRLLNRTVDFMRKLAPLSPTMKTNWQILEHTRDLVRAHKPGHEAPTDSAHAVAMIANAHIDNTLSPATPSSAFGSVGTPQQKPAVKANGGAQYQNQNSQGLNSANNSFTHA